MGVEAFHRLQHFGFGHRTLSACVVSSPIMRRPCSRKPSFLTILPAGDDRNAFPAARRVSKLFSKPACKASAGDGFGEPTQQESTTPLQAAPDDGEHTGR
jgi:hypothetical protein